MQKDRKLDIIFGVFWCGFSIYILLQSWQMPRSGTMAGLENSWYISPSFFPFFIGISLFIVSFFQLTIMIFNILRKKETISLKRHILKQKYIYAFAFIVKALIIYTLIYVPNYDFILASMYFILSTIGYFYITVQSRIFFIISFAIDFICLGLAALLPKDLCLLLLVLAYILSIMGKKGFGIAFCISFVSPVMIAAIFKYFLLVPLPHEGMIFEYVLDPIYYSIKPKNNSGLQELSPEDMNKFENAF